MSHIVDVKFSNGFQQAHYERCGNSLVITGFKYGTVIFNRRDWVQGVHGWKNDEHSAFIAKDGNLIFNGPGTNGAVSLSPVIPNDQIRLDTAAHAYWNRRFDITPPGRPRRAGTTNLSYTQPYKIETARIDPYPGLSQADTASPPIANASRPSLTFDNDRISESQFVAIPSTTPPITRPLTPLSPQISRSAVHESTRRRRIRDPQYRHALFLPGAPTVSLTFTTSTTTIPLTAATSDFTNEPQPGTQSDVDPISKANDSGVTFIKASQASEEIHPFQGQEISKNDLSGISTRKLLYGLARSMLIYLVLLAMQQGWDWVLRARRRVKNIREFRHAPCLNEEASGQNKESEGGVGQGRRHDG